MYYTSISQAKKEELSTHYTDTSTFVSQCLLFELLRKFQTQFYKSLVAIESKRLLEDSLQYYQKARQALLDGFLPENHPEIRKIDRMIQTEEILVRRLKEWSQKVAETAIEHKAI